MVKGGLQESPKVAVVAEKLVICSVGDGGVVAAAVALMTVYYVFMFEYPGSLKNLFYFCKSVCFR